MGVAKLTVVEAPNSTATGLCHLSSHVYRKQAVILLWIYRITSSLYYLRTGSSIYDVEGSLHIDPISIPFSLLVGYFGSLFSGTLCTI
jgi:hypothetical protein